jgi:ubiquinone/menaquinone biosynthesis C-methylase UbiE
MNPQASAPLQGKDDPRWAREIRKDRLPVRMDEHLKRIEEFFDHYAASVETWRSRNAGYHRTIASLSRFYIPRGARVLEIGSGTGDLLAATEPRHGVGIDISSEMVRLARS